MAMCLILQLMAVGFSLSIVDGLEYSNIVSKPLPSHMLMPVSLGSTHNRIEKRQALDMTQKIRIVPLYAENFDVNLQSKATLLRNDIIPRMLAFLDNVLSVAPISEPILITNNCSTNFFIPDPMNGNIICAAECAPTFCGSFRVPQEHLKQCRECRGSNNPSDCVVDSPAQDGAGVSDADFILYITAESGTCPEAEDLGSAQVVAFAATCQTESMQDRPVAGFINFCPNGVQNRDPEFTFAVTKHELLHALGFSRSLFPLWRDPSNNSPRTPRNSNTGLPDINNGILVVSDSTIETVNYNDWVSESGLPNTNVQRLVTPRVRDVARRHFNCSSLSGVELENQGDLGTSLSHWEKRVLGNEAMTGQLTFNPVFSEFTFAALEDSGWYRVNYSLADELIWGRDAGCRFAEGSCGEWIRDRLNRNELLTPFCNILESTIPTRKSCTVDHEAVSRCNLVRFRGDVPQVFQYFTESTFGGRVTIADFCPFQDVFMIRQGNGDILGTTCSVGSNLPQSNTLLEAYGPGSRCVVHGSQWTVNGRSIDSYGGGCYQYICSENMVTITIAGSNFSCSCSEAGQNRVIDLTVGGSRYEGSIICPSCTQICHATGTIVETQPVNSTASTDETQPVDSTASTDETQPVDSTASTDDMFSTTANSANINDGTIFHLITCVAILAHINF